MTWDIGTLDIGHWTFDIPACVPRNRCALSQVCCCPVPGGRGLAFIQNLFRSCYHRGMQKQAWAFLLIGFAIGFGVLYTWTKQRAPEVVRAMPLPVGTVGQQAAQSEPPPPPLDMARVQALQEQLKTNPRNFEALTELGNMQFDQKNYREAANWYTKALDVRPDELDLRTDLGTAMFYDNRFDDAIAQFKKHPR